MAVPRRRPHAFQQQARVELVDSPAMQHHPLVRWLRRAGMFCAFLLLLLSGTLTQLAQSGALLLPVAGAHAAVGSAGSDGKNTYQQTYDRGGTPHRPANQVKIAKGNSTPQVIKRGQGHLMPAFDVPLDLTTATTMTSPDGQLEIAVPAKAVTPALVTKAGGALYLHVTQLQGASGGSTSGHVIFGSFLITLMGPHGIVLSALAQRLTATLHLPSSLPIVGADMHQVQVAVVPSDAQGTPLKPANTTAAAQAAVAATVTSAAFQPGPRTLTTVFAAASQSGGGTTMTWDTNAADAHWSSQTDASVDLPSGNLTYSYPLDVPAGPGGLTPKLSFDYDSGSVGDNHNPAASAGWMGEGWSLTGGSISWGEHNVTSDCVSTCGNTWEDSWQFSDPYGNGGELIPADSNQAPWWDDTANGTLTLLTIPMTWHLSNETGVKIFSYENPTPNSYFPSQYYPNQPPCFRAFLPSGYMEEFGCTPDSLQWYVNTNSTNQNAYYPYRWDLDMIVDPNGNQIHFQYKQAMNGLASVGGHFPIDAVLSTISYDAAGCHQTTMCSGASWNPAVQIVFTSGSSPYHLSATTCSAQTYSNTTDYTSAQTMRCDDPADQVGGEKAPALQSLYVLNAVQVQVTTNPGSSPTWHTLRTYNFAYENGPWTTIYDPAIGWRESVAGYLNLTSMQEVGDNGSTTLPALYMTYTSYTENYLDQAYPSLKSDFCGPSWNTSCRLWSKTWNTRFLSELDNGQGWKETFTYAEAHNNTHGVNSGLNRLDPLACNGQQSGTNLCGKADDENWSRIVLTQRVGRVLCKMLQTWACQGGNGTDYNLDSTWSYTYTLTDVSGANMAQECSDCLQTMYWGNQNDGDVSDFYNAHFAGFKNVNVTSPDGSLQTYKYYTTKGYGVATSGTTCYSGNGCDVSPWSDPLNALHGRVQEEDDYDTNTTTLLKQTITAYAVTCPPNGVSASAHNAVDSQNYYVGQNTSELDHNNPIVTCRIDTTQVDTYQVDGGAPLSGTHSTTAYTYTYGSSTHRSSMKEDQSSNDTGATYHIITTTQYVWHDALTVNTTSASGIYFDQVPGKVQIQRYSGGYRGCTYYGYDGGAIGLTGQQAGLVRGLLTTTTRYATDCDPGAESGAVSTQATYNANGDLLATKDADAMAGISGHTDATDCTVNSVAYSACANYDSLYGTQVTRVFNALHRQTNLNYVTDGSNTNSPDATNGWGQWITTSTDPNNRVSAYGYDALGRLTATALPGDTLSSPTTSYQYVITCPTTGATYPCAALAKTQQLSSGVLATSATYYDGWGRPVETVTPAFETLLGSQTTVTYSVSYTMYDASGRKVFVSDPYLTTEGWSGAIGVPQYFTPDGNVAGTTTTYDGLGRVLTTKDPLNHVTTTSYSEQQPQGANISDTGIYAAATVVDARGHQMITLTDGLGRTRYTESFTGTSGSFALYGVSFTTDDPLDGISTVYGPAASGPAGVSTIAQTTTTYDLMNRKTGMSDADLGNGWTFAYDANGNQTSVVDPRGGASYAGYDGLNRQLWRNTTNSPTGAYVTYTYDQTTAHGYGIGHLTSESFTGGNASQPLHGAYSYYYGARGEITNFTLTTTENATYTLAYGYNDALQPTSLTYSDGEVFAESYTPEGWLAGATTTPPGSTNAPIQLLNTITYSGVGGAAGHITAANIGNSTYSYSASYDNALRLTQLSVTNVSTSTSLFSMGRYYDQMNNVVTIGMTVPTGWENQVFCYDDLNRLTWAGSTGTIPCGRSVTWGSLPNYTATYSYDPLNRITGGSLGTMTYGDSTHLHAATASTSGESATYDAAGDMLCRAPTSATTCAGGSPTGAQLTYDAERRLTSWQNAPTNPTSQAWFMYDGEGHRVEQYASGGSGNHTYYLPGNVEEVTPSGTLVKYYSAGGLALGLNTTSDSSGSGIAYLVSDGLGSVSEALSPTGTASGVQLYSPYGTVRYSSGVMPTAKGFTGQYSDAATSGLDYYGARYYDPQLGQFTSADTVTDGLNRYGYVKGNPETFTDPTGHRIYCGDGDCGAPPPPPTRPSGPPIGGIDETNLAVAGGTFSWYRARGLSAARVANTKSVYVSGYTRANGTVVQPYMRHAPGYATDAADAARYARWARITGYGVVAAGAVLDGVLKYADYYNSEDPNDPERQQKAIVAGVMHAAISTSVTVLLVAGATAIPVCGQTGICQVAAGVLGGAIGGVVADWAVNPTTVDFVTDRVNDVGNAASAAGNQIASTASAVGNQLGDAASAVGNFFSGL